MVPRSDVCFEMFKIYILGRLISFDHVLTNSINSSCFCIMFVTTFMGLRLKALSVYALGTRFLAFWHFANSFNSHFNGSNLKMWSCECVVAFVSVAVVIL